MSTASSPGTDADDKPVDYTSRVEQGAVLARIDDALYQADVAQSEAEVRAAKAGVQRAEKDLLQLKAKLSQAQRDWERAEKLGRSDTLSQSDRDSYESAHEVARANVDVGQAAAGGLQVHGAPPLACGISRTIPCPRLRPQMGVAPS